MWSIMHANFEQGDKFTKEVMSRKTLKFLMQFSDED